MAARLLPTALDGGAEMTMTRAGSTGLATMAVAAGLAAATASHAQSPTELARLRVTAEQLRDRALAGASPAYDLVESLTTDIGPRPAGSAAQHRAAQWGVERMRALGFENVHIESFPVSYWKRGEERAEVVGVSPQRLVIAGLGGTVPTPPGGIEAEIALFRIYDDMLAAPPGSLTGKIAVVTEPMGPTQDGSSYGAHYRIRGEGAVEAARRGAVGYLMRSLASDARRLPHTGSMRYVPEFADKTAAVGATPGQKPPARIPAAALSVPDAEQLERLVKRGRPVRVRMLLTSATQENATADTVVGEIRGRERPDEIVLIGGHLDSWDLGTGAIDDGAGVAITTAAAKLIRDLPQRPRRTIRVAMFGAEEIGAANTPFAAAHKAEEGKTIIASESDFGADRVYAVSLPAGAVQSAWGRSLGAVLAPLKVSLSREVATDGGADLEKLVGVPLAALAQDGSRYFELHHTADDTLDKIDRRQMDQNVAAWAAFIWMAADSNVDFRAIAASAPAASPGRR